MSAEILAVKYNENNVPYIGIGKHEIRLESEPPTEAIIEKARKELREVPEIVEPAIVELREMLQSKYIRCLCYCIAYGWLVSVLSV